MCLLNIKMLMVKMGWLSRPVAPCMKIQRLQRTEERNWEKIRKTRYWYGHLHTNIQSLFINIWLQNKWLDMFYSKTHFHFKPIGGNISSESVQRYCNREEKLTDARNSPFTSRWWRQVVWGFMETMKYDIGSPVGGNNLCVQLLVRS